MYKSLKFKWCYLSINVYMNVGNGTTENAYLLWMYLGEESGEQCRRGFVKRLTLIISPGSYQDDYGKCSIENNKRKYIQQFSHSWVKRHKCMAQFVLA